MDEDKKPIIDMNVMPEAYTPHVMPHAETHGDQGAAESKEISSSVERRWWRVRFPLSGSRC
jgi:hypothetical protein